MTDGAMGSTVPRRQLGRYLRELRSKARFTARAAAEKLEWSEAKLWRIETGQTSLRALDVEAMCALYGAPADLTEDLKRLAKETKARGWWQSYADILSPGFDVYLGLEEAASEIRGYEPELVPGLLQTADYFRAVLHGEAPTRDDAEIERQVQIRRARQALITRDADPAALHVVLNEAVVRRPVGGAAVMGDQLAHLCELATRPNIHVRVITYEVGAHPAMASGPFVIMRFPGNGNNHTAEPSVVYAEGATGALYLDKPHEVNAYETIFDGLWRRALVENKSRQLLSRITKDLRP